MFAVVVTFKIKAGMINEFMPLMLENAQASLRDEPACHQFDVCTDAAQPDSVFLYEIYSDLAGFDAHRQTPHFKKFDAAVSQMIESKDVRTFARVHQ
ncbi:putative quinol monooxygenase [Hoeflea sp. YIM 152468]|uniref:putative quinol monooxygenase n=1 Tax=Hoeflea sp. YIM 152468 TaxID=3031759 RepID=UPI0023DA0327|nr:putative quinol monooxygenase [Hoeflea sp. YIM 152468]MDF1610201.1 putative quinol monooxygenase [Hoeflea sp. YIM 152468]